MTALGAILRTWRGETTVEKAADYERHLSDVVFPELQDLTGFLGADVSRQKKDDRFVYLVQTRWQSMDAIEGFAGRDLETAVVPPEAQAVLERFDQLVEHFEVVLTAE